MSARWHFVEHIPGHPISNALGGEHFDDEEEDWKPGEVLVRECVQNSLDAAHNGACVTVRFQIRNSGAMPASTAHFWLSSLWPHLLSSDCKLPGVPTEPRAGGFVVVEDFGTSGLVGDTRQYGLADKANRFLSFFRADGLSGNRLNDTTGGSWGVGKSVLNRCSSINTFLALSVRRDESDAVLIGKSMLWHHRTQDGEFQSTGHFGRIDDPMNRLVMPEAHPDMLSRFINDFGLTRSVDGSNPEPGLSVVIPYPHLEPEITAHGIVDIVIREYFRPILAGKLRVQVDGSFAGEPRTVEITDSNLLSVAKQMQMAEMTNVLELAEWAHRESPDQAGYRLSEPPKDAPPRLSDDLLRVESPEFQKVRERYELGEIVAFRVPLWVKPKGLPPELSEFTVLLRRDLDGRGYRPVFVRGWIVVPNARKRAVRNHSLFSLVIIDEKDALEILLRAAEPPAHTSWSATTSNIRNRYDYGRQSIDFVLGVPKFLAEALSSAETERDLDVWADFFPSPVQDGQRPAKGQRQKGDKRPPLPAEPPKPRLKPFKIDQLSDGFTVARDNPAETPLPDKLTVRFAYDTSRGNAIKKYNKADFRAQDLTVLTGDCQVLERVDNTIVLRPAGDNFRLEVRGLDINRDAIVKVRTIDGAAGDDQ